MCLTLTGEVDPGGLVVSWARITECIIPGLEPAGVPTLTHPPHAGQRPGRCRAVARQHLVAMATTVVSAAVQQGVDTDGIVCGTHEVR